VGKEVSDGEGRRGRLSCERESGEGGKHDEQKGTIHEAFLWERRAGRERRPRARNSGQKTSLPRFWSVEEVRGDGFRPEEEKVRYAGEARP
jgi:hypothetical protein